MKISRIGLEAYGHFAGRLIELRTGVPLTIVHGGNEAGKTTALNAIADVLYGIETRSTYGFRHGLPDMKVAATFVSAEGVPMAVRRIKRQNRTLVDFETNAPLPDDALEVFLKGRTRTAFLDVFGLDRERLRAGGKKLMQGGGDLADSLVAAAPGLGNVLAIRDKLIADAASFHNHTRKVSSTALAQAISARDAARKAIRDREIRADEVKRLRMQAEEADRARLAAVEAEAQARMEVARLDRLQQAARELSSFDRLVATRAGLGDVPQVPPEILAAARASLKALAEARRLDDMCRSEHRSAEEALAAIVVDDVLLDAAEKVQTLDDRRAVVANALEDIPKRQDEIGEIRGKLARIASTLGLPDLDAMRRLLPGDPMLARADRLIDRIRALEIARADAGASLARAESARTKLDVELARVGHAEDPSGFRRRLDALDGCEERATAAKRAQRATAAETKRIDAIVEKLALGARDLESLASLPLPSVAKANALLKRIADAEGELQRATEAVRSLAEDEARCSAKVDAIKAPGEVPTPAAVEAARRARDATWMKVRPVLAGERPAADADAVAAIDLDESIALSDRLADDRWAGSARAAELLQAEVALADGRIRAQNARAAMTDRQRLLDEALRAWTEIWHGISAGKGEPSEIVERLRGGLDAIALRDRLAELREDEDARVAASGLDARRIDELGRDLGLAASGDGFAVADLRAAIAMLNSRFQERRDVERDLKNNEDAFTDLKLRQKSMADEATSIETEAAEILPALSVRDGAASDEAKAALGLWRDAKSLLPALEQLEHRVDRIKDMKRDFEAEAFALIHLVAPDLAGPDAFLGVRQLRTRVDTMRQAQSRAEDARLNLIGRSGACERSTSTLKTVVQEAEALRTHFGGVSEDEMAPLLDRVEEALTIDGDLRRARPRVDEALAGRAEDDVRAELGDADPVALVGLRTIAESAAGAASADVAVRIEQHVLARTALLEMEARGGAAAAAQDEQDALAAMAAAAEGFVRNHTAARILAAAVDRYREKHQSPIIARASSAFTALTGGRWEGIGVDYGEEQPVLKPLRDGKFHDLKALSEGTADQLFLALRVAAIEEHAAASTPLPFIADDLFTSFDETRTEAGLSLLADLGHTTQVLLFTHHEHVAAGAQRALGERVDIVRL